MWTSPSSPRWLGPDGLGGEVFAQDRSADAMRPGPVLAALTEQAAGDLGRLTDNQVSARCPRRGGWRPAPPSWN